MGGDYYERQMSTDNLDEPSEHEQPANLYNYEDQNQKNQIFGGVGSTIGNKNNIDIYNSQRNKIGRQNGLHPTLDPRLYKDNNLKTKSRFPVVFALDVTGSMCEWPQIIYDKMPMFFGQIMMNNYLSELQISFCAVADYGDEITLQITEFSDAHQIDERINLLYLGGGMGPLVRHEAYEAAGFFYSYMVDLEEAELPFFFLTCDEDYYPEVAKYRIKKKLGRDYQFEEVKGRKVFADLVKKYNVFIIKKPYDNKIEEGELNQWISAVGKSRILIIDNPKASIDLILGAIAVTNGRTLVQYVEDMKKRGQTDDRIKSVVESLKEYNDSLKEGKVKIVRNNVQINIKEKNSVKVVKNLNEMSIEEKIDTFRKNFNGCDFSKDEYLNDLNKEYQKVHQEFNGKIPEELLCPLTNKLFVEPVKVEDGSIFERQAIDKWFDLFDCHPIKSKIISKNYMSDCKTSSEVNEYYETVRNLI